MTSKNPEENSPADFDTSRVDSNSIKAFKIGLCFYTTTVAEMKYKINKLKGGFIKEWRGFLRTSINFTIFDNLN